MAIILAMPKTPLFTITYARQTYGHLAIIDRKFYSLIENTVDEQLRHKPLIRTRNRKPLRHPTSFGATWELRCGPDNRFRILYAVDVQEREVIVVAIGAKIGGRLFIGKEKFDL
jgi:mRNA-degrading endonuclease RelE of RelBE toxin-antitoxin system